MFFFVGKGRGHKISDYFEVSANEVDIIRLRPFSFCALATVSCTVSNHSLAF